MAALLDAALEALPAGRRRTELDASYARYDETPPSVLVNRRGRLSDDRMREVCAALAVAVDCE